MTLSYPSRQLTGGYLSRFIFSALPLAWPRLSTCFRYRLECALRASVVLALLACPLLAICWRAISNGQLPRGHCSGNDLYRPGVGRTLVGQGGGDVGSVIGIAVVVAALGRSRLADWLLENGVVLTTRSRALETDSKQLIENISKGE